MIKKSFFIFLLLFVGLFLLFIPHDRSYNFSENRIFSFSDIELCVPKCPLKSNSLIVEAFTKISFLDWTPSDHTQAYFLLENVASLWKTHGIHDFLIIGTIPPSQGEKYFWEILPYSKTSYNLLEQLRVVWRLTFGSSCLSNQELESAKNRYQKFSSYFSLPYRAAASTLCMKEDPFCNPLIINKQLLYKGKTINVLYNYAPQGIGPEKLHFLLVTKEHRGGFPELTLEEYVEAQEIASKIIHYYHQKGFPIAYLFHKTGKLAGQTVPHWHEHLIFAADQSSEFWGKLKLMGRMIFPASPLSDPELKKLVKKYREQVQEAIKKKEMT